MDYFATGALKPHVAENVVRGFVAGCKENDCALIGGETAEMPSMYSEGDYDLAGTIVGVVEKDRILTGQNVQKGDMLLGLASSGLHTNGYSLARHILFPKYDVNAHVDELGTSLSEALLATHRSYLSIVYPLLEKKLIRAISHVTGGGIIGNTKRVIPEGCSINIDWTSWEVPPLFQLLQSEGNVPVEDMRRTFNMGIGIILVVRPEDITTVRTMIPEQCFEIGVVE
jgi:phosphoribosylformylglycinamidine cyclo-ligase